MADLSTHYKEREPKQTVQLIKDFFAEHGFRIELSNVNQSEAGTHYCHVDLYQDKVLLGGANGKGMTNEYALASGYAELYERFCNQIQVLSSPLWGPQYMERSRKAKGYYFRKDERIQTYDEMYHCCRRATEYFDSFCGKDEELKHAMAELMMGNKFVGVPMKNIDGSDEIYIDPRLLLRIVRSNGMAAGNTLNEALAQAISEVVEREVCFHTFTDQNILCHAINLETITNPELRDKIEKIRDAGYDFYLVDLSYNYSLPVLMSLLINKDDGIVNVNFGSFPVFDIAAERVITELYQGIDSYKSKPYKMRLQVPFKGGSIDEIYMRYGNSITGEFLSSAYVDNIRIIDHYNDKVFVDKNVSNEELVEYYCKLMNQLGAKVYYLDNSLIPEIKAVHVIIETTDLYHAYSICQTIPMNWTRFNKEIALQQVRLHLSFYNGMLQPNVRVDAPLITTLRHTWIDRDRTVGFFLDNTLLWNTVFPLSSNVATWYVLNTFIYPNSDDIFIPDEMVGRECFTEYKKYMQLLLYVRCGQYTSTELLDIFNNKFNYNITEEDINKCMSPAYLLQRAYIEPLHKFILSDEYHAIMDTYIDNLPS